MGGEKLDDSFFFHTVHVDRAIIHVAMNGTCFSRQPNGAWIRYAIICVMDVESDIELDSYQTLHNVHHICV